MPDSEKLRLQLFMARAGVASRRASEQIILDGRVKVNGITVTELGTKVSLTDKVEVDSKQISLEEEKRYVLLNKPAGYVCTMADEKGRPIASDLLKSEYTERLYNVGRLDMFSTGAILFTNDGEFAAKLSHPSAQLEKEYIVETSTAMPRSLAEDFMKGVRVDNVFYKALDCKELNSRKMRIILIEGKNREIRRVFESYEIGIKSLKRIRIGCVGLGELKDGEHRNLTAEEVKSLIKLCSNY